MLAAKYFKKQWFLLDNGTKAGPYSCSELKCDPRFTPDTLMWKEGFKEWRPAREIEELNFLFQDPQELISPVTAPQYADAEGTLTLDQLSTPPFWWWLLVVATILIWILFFNEPR